MDYNTTNKANISHPHPDRDEKRFLVESAEAERVREETVSFVRQRVQEADAEGVVVPMSGGIDSTVTAAVAAGALDTERVLALGLPCHKTEDLNATDTRTIADGLGIEYQEIHLQRLLDLFTEQVESTIGPTDDQVVTGNVIARLRMVCAYYAANAIVARARNGESVRAPAWLFHEIR